MALLFETIPADLFAVFVVIWTSAFIYYKSLFGYWSKRNLPVHSKPQWFLGNAPNPFLVTASPGQIIKTAYNNAKFKGFKHAGGYSFHFPKYFPIDPEFIKNVLLRDHSHFTERGFYYNERDDPLSANLFALGGEKWRILRSKLSPAYTSGKLKFMFDELRQCALQMEEYLDKSEQNGKGAISEIADCFTGDVISSDDSSTEIRKEVNVSEIADCFTVDVIGSCAFGLECNSFKHPEAEFRVQGRKIFYFTKLRALKTVFAFLFPKLSRKLGVTLFDRDSNNFFVNVVKTALDYRKNNNVVRRDFLHLLLEMTEDDKSEKKFSIEELTAQVFVFFAAGFETSSLTLAFCLYELALQQDLQDTLREEINQVLDKYEGKITYDAVMDMKYLNQVIEETLRKYPPVPFITRVCIKDYKVPETETIIEKGLEAVISIWGVHHDPDHYPDPMKFDPERFSEEGKRNRHPFAYLPFGEGPRMCIGLRFGLMQAKVGVISLLKNFKFTPNKKTQVPIEMEPFSFTLIPKKSISLNIERTR